MLQAHAVQRRGRTPGACALVLRRRQGAHRLDNIAFLSRDQVTFVEDAGDGLHGQRNALDSGYVFDVRRDYAEAGATTPVRWLAEGRDASATIDAANDGFGKNDGDNEITGVHVSDGDPTAGGILGAKMPAAARAAAGAGSGPSSTATT